MSTVEIKEAISVLAERPYEATQLGVEVKDRTIKEHPFYVGSSNEIESRSSLGGPGK